MDRFEALNAQVVGVSVDHVPCLKAWATNLGGIDFPLLSDFWPHGGSAREWGVFRETDGHSERAIFVIDRDGIVRYVDVHDIADQPDNEVLFAELEKLEPGLAAAERQVAEAGTTLTPEAAPAAAAVEREPAAETAAAGEAPTPPPAPAEQAATVRMYCRTWCPDCARARAWLDANGIPYVEVDVDVDAEARARAASHNEGRLHTPTFEIGEDVCVDFREERLRALLGR